MLNKKWFAVSILILLVFYSAPPTGHANEGTQTSFTFDVNGDQTNDYSLRLEGWATTVEPQIEVVNHEQATYHHYRYRQGSNYFRLTVMKQNNGDVLYTARNYPSAVPNEVRLSVTAHDAYPTARAYVPPGKGVWDAASNKQLPGTPAGWKQLESLPSLYSDGLYLDSNRLHYRIGQGDVFKPLGYSVFQELPEQRKPTQILHSTDQVTYTTPLHTNGETFSDAWGVLSARPLVRWDNPAAVREATQLELQHDKKLSVDGAYYATPNNYRPYAPASYYLNPANVLGMRMVPLMNADYGGLFENVATHLAYASAKMQTSEGHWPTAPRSLWLSGDYGIEYNYMDNRRNADNATFLLRFMQQKPDPMFQTALNKWDQYQQIYIDKHKINSPSEGILIPDYTGDAASRTSHISLNHHVSILNYLLESYKLDQDPQKLIVAESLLKGIESTVMTWIMPNHNLYYALTPDLKPYKPDQYPDYHVLTRDDLEVAQWLLTTVGKERSSQLQLLIEQKNVWISQQ